MRLSRFRLPTRLNARHPARKWLAGILIGLLSVGMVLVIQRLPSVEQARIRADDVLYDTLLYGRRPREDRTSGDIVILTVDDRALREMDSDIVQPPVGWPWPRAFWGGLVQYLEKCGARAVVFDVLFSETSVRGDDDEFGERISQVKIPVIFGSMIKPDGTPEPFKPQVKSPLFGAANTAEGTVQRQYSPFIYGTPSLALRAAAVTRNGDISDFRAEPFRLHYYGPWSNDGKTTYPYLSVARVVGAATDFALKGEVKRNYGFNPDQFRGKIIFIGYTAPGLYDLKSSPVSSQYPGVEVHVTATDNLLRRQWVHPVHPGVVALTAILASLIASLGVVLPRQTLAKLLGSALMVMFLVGLTEFLFMRPTIHWLPVVTPLASVLIATVGGFAWSYLREDRARQLLFKALSQNLSPELAARVASDPEWLNRLGGDRREMTVMFTDIAGFTDLSEKMEVEKLTDLMNYYLEEMSGIVLKDRAYLDKYIGDAIMSFWNGVIDQPDHALLACRTALDMQRREREMQPELSARGATGLLTRMGINSGPMAIGNMGSSHKFAFTVLGDSVNLGSRLEGANKLYGSQILISQSTADRVRGKMIIRQLDLLRVKGKKQPMAVYELMAEGTPDAAQAEKISLYEAALSHYQKQNWDAAEQNLSQLLGKYPDDAPAVGLLKRVKQLRDDPPGPDWDGVYVAKDK